jgi:hypothetical protein
MRPNRGILPAEFMSRKASFPDFLIQEESASVPKIRGSGIQVSRLSVGVGPSVAWD